MKVFISWSGETSKAMAKILYDWLPKVIQALDPWMSDVDIDKGARWRVELDKALECNVGIFCLTDDNLKSPFLHYEAGAIAKKVTASRACTFLYRLKPSDVAGPLSDFQHTTTDKDEIRKLLDALNAAVKDSGEKALDEVRLKETFDMLWPHFDAALKKVTPSSHAAATSRTQDDKIDEILELVRSLNRTPPQIDYNQFLKSKSFAEAYMADAMFRHDRLVTKNLLDVDPSKEGAIAGTFDGISNITVTTPTPNKK